MVINISANISDVQAALQTLSFSESLPFIKPLLLYILGLAIYSIFIFKFYRFIAKKDIFSLDLQQYNTAETPKGKKIFGIFLYILEYLILFPLFAAFWFTILFVLLVFLSKNQVIESILLTSMAIIAIVRITAYYNDDLSKDLAKMLPFTLLGIFLVDSSYFSTADSILLLKQFPLFWKSFIYYFFFVVVLEFVCRIFYTVWHNVFSPKTD